MDGVVAGDFASARNELVRRPGLSGPGRRAAMTALTDQWLGGLFTAATATAKDPFCLVAIGGYGRGELTAGSDLDLLLLHKSGATEAGRVAEALWYPIWDAGQRLDHSVRTVSEARRLASEDLKVVLGMLDLRAVAGDPALAEQLQSVVLGDWRAMAERRLPELRDMVLARRQRFGEASQLVEPDLKESYGGLRDATILRGVAASWVTDVPHNGHGDAVDFLLDVRDSLHRLTGSSSDRLLMQEQDAIAEDLVGVRDADALLRAVYDSARRIAYASDVTWHHVDRLTRQRQRTAFRPIKRRTAVRLPLAEGVVMQEGEVVLALEAKPARDEGLVLRAAAAAAQGGLQLSPHTVERLATEGVEPAVPWSREVRESFVSLLGSGPALVGVWEALDQSGVISRLLPGWDVVRSAPQRNALHKYTVDRHLVETAVQASALTRNVDRPDLLLVSALLHDIGKARGGDHSEVGARIAEGLAQRMGFADDDARAIVALVRHHLLLADTATRRDLEDPVVVNGVRDLLGDVAVLDLLHELTIADSLATGPTVATEWRFGLIGDLVERVRATMAGRALPEPPGLTEQQQVALAQRGVWVLMDVRDASCLVTVAAPDRIGLLSLVAGVLSLNRLNVLAAKVTTVGDRAVQEWTVRPAFGDPPAVEQLSDDIRRAVDGTYDVAARLARRDADYARTPAVAYPEPNVAVMGGTSATTVLEVRAHDQPGLLYRVAQSVSAADVTIVGAKVSTLGSDAVDVFFVTDPQGNRLGPDRAAALRTTVLAALSS
ncbi:MAG: [protein-PII] uridylyltransferase [Actinomycetota bacterium]|nr:[protein-PII] uridylyltransferase [Actinomycetota bacterium]